MKRKNTDAHGWAGFQPAAKSKHEEWRSMESRFVTCGMARGFENRGSYVSYAHECANG